MRRSAKIVLIVAGVLIASTAAGLLVAQMAGAHTNEGHSADCQAATFLFDNFPQGENEITVALDGNEADYFFVGTAGQVTADWIDHGVDVTDGAIHTYGASWSADGGGSTDVFTFDAYDCIPPATTVPPPTTEPPGPPPCFDPYTPGVPGCPTIPTTVPDDTDDDDGAPPPPPVVPAGPVAAEPATTG
jgi:hypothetical protein